MRRAIAESSVSVVAAGVGCVGPLDQKTGYVIRPVNLPGWKEVALVDTLRNALGIPVYLDNDANAAALGEHRFGAGRGVRNMVYLTISTASVAASSSMIISTRARTATPASSGTCP